MFGNCLQCATAISNRSRPGISCCGCNNQIHSSCLSKEYDVLAIINSVPGLSWRCLNCTTNCIMINHAEIKEMLKSEVKQSLADIEVQINDLKSELSKSAAIVPKPLDPPKTRQGGRSQKDLFHLAIHSKNRVVEEGMKKIDVVALHRINTNILRKILDVNYAKMTYAATLKKLKEEFKDDETK
ncbi:hypothetical protein FQR65_LT07755 [Abscondita terminalis]|nr:hypothetical protein FQR65_LT07755 [Abscondita terminalis]